MTFAKARYYILAFLFISSVTIDQLFKFWATNQGIVQYNSGISMSWLPGSNQFTLGLILSLFLVAVAWWWQKIWLEHPGWSGLFFGGACSNIVDRFLYAGVRDWMILPGLNLKNNLADWFVCIGLALILAQVLDQKKSLKPEDKYARD